MLTIPAIDLIQGRCVRLYRGDFNREVRYDRDPVEQAQAFEAVGFSRIHVIDLEGARSGSSPNRRIIQELAGKVSVPLQVGGGVRTREDVSELIESGVAYLILGTVALTEPETVAEWIQKWGPDPFIVSLDLKNGKLQSQGWLKASPVSLERALERISKWGITQIICTDIERDGTLKRPNYSTYVQLLERSFASLTLIAAGGISRLEHIYELEKIGVKGVVVGRAIYEGEISIEQLANVS